MATVGYEPAGSIEDVAPCPLIAAAVVALAAGLACLPAAVVIASLGMPAPLAFGLGLVGASLSCFKVVLMIYGIGKVGLAGSPAG